MVTITYANNGIIIEGHAKDPVVCHGISAITQMVANYVADKGWGDVSQAEGHLEINNIGWEYYSNDLFRAMSKGLGDIAEEYPGNVVFEYR